MLSIPPFAMIVVDQQTAMTDVTIQIELQGFPVRNPVTVGTLFLPHGLPHGDVVGAVG
jgi:hypothetical protein